MDENLINDLEALVERAAAEVGSADEILERRRKRYAEIDSAGLLRAVNMAYVAERFFGRSRAWLCQKLNHSLVNGKPARFTEAEAQQLRRALASLADELQALAEDMEL